MKRFILFLLVASLWCVAHSFVGCADPMQNVTQSPAPPPGATHDTVSTVDTVVVIDTVIQVDTVIVVVPDTGTSTQLCSRIGSGQHEIVWILQDQDGLYTLDFVAMVARDQPVQSVVVDIDGKKFSWSPSKNPEFVTIQHLSPHAVIRIFSTQPCAFGHPIDICLAVRHK